MIREYSWLSVLLMGISFGIEVRTYTHDSLLLIVFIPSKSIHSLVMCLLCWPQATVSLNLHIQAFPGCPKWVCLWHVLMRAWVIVIAKSATKAEMFKLLAQHRKKSQEYKTIYFRHFFGMLWITIVYTHIHTHIYIFIYIWLIINI